MKLSTRTRYGTRLMLELGRRYGLGPVFLSSIAGSEHISEKYLSQIILPLKASGLVVAHRGAHGGYELSRMPSGITMDQIVCALEGELMLVDCFTDRESCARVHECVTRELWQSVRQSMIDSLKKVTLDDLVKKSKDNRSKETFYNI